MDIIRYYLKDIKMVLGIIKTITKSKIGYIYIYIYIYIYTPIYHHHHHQIMQISQIPLTLSCHLSLLVIVLWQWYEQNLYVLFWTPMYSYFRLVSMVYVFTLFFPCLLDMARGQFLRKLKQVWLESFPSLCLIAKPRLKNPVCPTIYL